MTRRSGKRRSWTKRESRKHSSDALRYAMTKEAATQADVGKWSGNRTIRTVGSWLSRKSALELESVLCSGRLRGHFLRYLSVCDRKK